MPNQIDINSASGNDWWKGFIKLRIGLFWLGCFAGIHLIIQDGYHAFWWSVPIGIVGGFLYLMTSMAWETQAAVEANKQHKEMPIRSESKAQNDIEQKTQIEAKRTRFDGLIFGQSDAMLYNREHIGGLEAGFLVQAAQEDCSKNIIIMGGIGGGKTSRSINPLLLQILQQNAGALIFDIKTDFHKEVSALTQRTGRTYTVIGDGGLTLNLLRGTTPELAASFLKSCFLMQGQGNGDSAFWVDSATEMATHCMQLRRIVKGGYSIAQLYNLVFDQRERESMLSKGVMMLDEMTDRDQRFFIQIQRFFVNVWNEHDEKVRRNILSTMNSVLGPFSHPDMVDAFSSGSTDGEADLTTLINDGAVFLVNLPQTKYGREGARFAYMLLKLRFMNMMRERGQHADWNQTRPVAFVCDEYQSIIDSISDTDFWDKSRSTKTIGMVSMQGISSLVEALKGNKQTADAILQNFRQRLIFRTEDEATLRHIQQVLGQVEVHLTGTGESISESESWAMGQRMPTHSVSDSQSTSTSINRWDLFSANDMRGLDANRCLMIGNIGDRAVDEVLNVQPLYLN